MNTKGENIDKAKSSRWCSCSQQLMGLWKDQAGFE